MSEESKDLTASAAPATVTAHDDFDWSVDKRNKVKYTQDESAKYDKIYGESFTTVGEKEIVIGKVVSITDTDVVMNIGFKSDGMVPLSEFRDMENLKVGDDVEVYIVTKEDSKGQLVLSRKNAKMLTAWTKIVDAYKTQEIVKGFVVSKTKGGLIVNVFGLETFLPGSQIDVKPITDYDQYVGKTMDFKVVKINEAIRNAVVSHKALIESDIEQQRMEIIGKLEKGQVLEGTIKNITDFGAFIDLGGVDGLLYITDISWGRINHPSDVLKLDQKLNVVVLDYDDDKKRISLGLKQLQPHPWDALESDIQVGSKLHGRIVNVEDYGAFLELKPGVEGLIHISEVSWSSQPINSKDYFKVGQEFDAIVMTIDREERKMSLSLKQLTPDPWTLVPEKYAVGSRHSGTVKNITPYGVFVELEDGIGGMVHISDLSWTKRYNHPNEFTKVGNKLDVVVLEIDNENRKLSLGHKQIEEDPWDTFENIFPIGSIHEATVMAKDDKGAKILLPYGLEAYAPKRQLKKEDNSFPNNDEKIMVKVVDLNRNDRKIMVSHSRMYEDVQKDGGQIEEKSVKKDESKARKTTKETSNKVEKTTLGDLSVLSDLKAKMDSAEGKSAASSEENKTEGNAE